MTGQEKDCSLGGTENAWWISFYIPDEHVAEFELHAPWWVSGYGDEETIIVVAIRAVDKEAAWQRVIDAFDDEAQYRERFCGPLGRDTPFVDRFPKASWMEWSDTSTCACEMAWCDGRGPSSPENVEGPLRIASSAAPASVRGVVDYIDDGERIYPSGTENVDSPREPQ